MMELYLNTVYNLDPGKFLREGRFVILEYSPNFLKEAQPNVMAAPNSSETYMFYLNTQLNVKLFNCCRCTGMTHPEYWWCQQYLTKDKFSEEEETNFEMYTTQSDYRTWREYLVRDVKFKNKSPVSWSCSPPGSRLSAFCSFIHLERSDYKWCKQCGWILCHLFRTCIY